MLEFTLPSFLVGVTAEDSFWWFFIIAIVCFVGFCVLAEESPWVAFALNFASAVTILIYSQLAGDQFWFMEWGDGEHWFRWFVGLFCSAGFLGICFRLAWEHVKMILALFSMPLLAIVGVVIGLAWFFAAMNMVGALASEHTFAFILILLGALPSGGAAHVPTIYVDGEGHITGRGYHGGDRFHGDNGNEYEYDGSSWHRD